jgi:hypothetical protein
VSAESFDDALYLLRCFWSSCFARSPTDRWTSA